MDKQSIETKLSIVSSPKRSKRKVCLVFQLKGSTLAPSAAKYPSILEAHLKVYSRSCVALHNSKPHRIGLA